MMKQSLRWKMEHKSPYLTRNMHPNVIMLTLHDFLNIRCYTKMLNGVIYITIIKILFYVVFGIEFW